MKSFVRFGKRIELPSTVQIVHELMTFSAEEDVRELCAQEEGLPVSASWNVICAHRAEPAKAA